MKNNFKISIGSKQVLIQERFTLILGKFKKNLLNNFKNDNFIEILEKLDSIPMDKLINIFQEDSEQYSGLDRSLNLLAFINEYRMKINQNIEVTSQYYQIIQILSEILEFNFLLKKKDFFQKELEISIQHKQSSEIKANLDLLNKLNNSLNINKNKLKYLEEDFFQRKDQFDQIIETINQFKLKIQDLTKEKKTFFSQINQITREMTAESRIIQTEDSEPNNNLTNAEKIRKYQTQAKEVQFKINSINSKISQSQKKLEELKPIYDSYKNDYLKVKELVKKEEQNIIELESQLKSKIKGSENISSTDLEYIDLKLLRPSQEIEIDIDNINHELEKVSIPEEIFNIKNPEDISMIIAKLQNFEKNLRIDKPTLEIKTSEEDLKESLENFRNLDTIIKNLESMINKFTIEIKISSHFEIIINNDEQKFFINIEFIRNNKERVKFDELTTPEKIFFIIVLYLSIKIQTKKENILFSNVSIPNKYNKAGSIFRTIRKVIPIFENEKILSRFSLTFIISNLEMKREIKNLKNINLEES